MGYGCAQRSAREWIRTVLFYGEQFVESVDGLFSGELLKNLFIEKRGEPLNWGSQGITIYIFSREFSLISLVSLFYLLFDETKNTTHNHKRQQQRQQSEDIQSGKDFILSKRHTHDEKNMRTVNQNYGEKNVSSVAQFASSFTTLFDQQYHTSTCDYLYINKKCLCSTSQRSTARGL